MSRRRNGFPVAPIDGLFQKEVGTGDRLMLPDEFIDNNAVVSGDAVTQSWGYTQLWINF